MLRRILAPKRDKYCSGNQIEKNEMGGACSMYWEKRDIYRILVGKPVVKRPLGRPRRRCDDSLKTDLKQVGWWGYGLDRAGSG